MQNADSLQGCCEMFERAGEAAKGSNLQDILRLLTLWFTHGSAPDVERALEEGFGHVSIDTWLVVIPQVHQQSLSCVLSSISSTRPEI